MIVQWMAGMMVASALVALSAWSLERVLRAWRLPVRWVWLGALLAVMLLPWVSWLLARLTVPELVGAGATVVLPSASLLALPVAAVVADPPLWNVLAGVAWGVLAGATLIVYLAGWARLARARRAWRPARMAGARVLVAPGLGPAAVGVMQPVIVVPDWLLGRDGRTQRLVVLHEAEHLRAGDHLVLGLAPLALVLMPWNIALWWMLRELRVAVELDCDGRVLSRGVGAVAYGSLLLDVAGRGGTPALVPGLAMSRPRLERRLVALLRDRSRWPWVSALPFAAAAIVFGGLACETAPVMPPEEEPAAAEPEVEDAVRVHGVPASAQPLILIDGVAATQEQMDALDPQSIERIEVVKGAAAARLVPGNARAGNGVIMIFLRGEARTPAPAAPIPLPRRVGLRLEAPRVVPAIEVPRLATRIGSDALRARTATPRITSGTTIRVRRPESLRVSETPIIYIDGVRSDMGTVRALVPEAIGRIEIVKGQPSEIRVTTRR